MDGRGRGKFSIRGFYLLLDGGVVYMDRLMVLTDPFFGRPRGRRKDVVVAHTNGTCRQPLLTAGIFPRFGGNIRRISVSTSPGPLFEAILPALPVSN